MEQLEFFAVLSPCIGVCQVNNKGYCKGCFRNRDERFRWLTLNASQQQEVIRLCQDRKRRVLAAARRRAHDADSESAQQQELPF